MGIKHWESHTGVAMEAWRARWPNFTPAELACSHCGSLVVDEEALDALQRARTAFGKPVRVAAAYRCPAHELEAAKPRPGSHSRGAAFDTYPVEYDAQEMRSWIQCCAEEAFKGFGMGLKGGSMHFHVDMDVLYGWRAWGY